MTMTVTGSWGAWTYDHAAAMLRRSGESEEPFEVPLSGCRGPRGILARVAWAADQGVAREDLGDLLTGMFELLKPHHEDWRAVTKGADAALEQLWPEDVRVRIEAEARLERTRQAWRDSCARRSRQS